jgi:hypothetical protein
MMKTRRSLTGSRQFRADDYLGRVYSFTDGSAPDVTFAGWDPQKGVRLFGADGGRFWVPLAIMLASVFSGVLEESSACPSI